MIRSPLSVRLDANQPIREQVRQAAEAGARGIVVDATGDLAPGQLSETGRRELRHLFRSADLRLVALHLPTRRAFTTFDQLEDRLSRAARAFALAVDLGTNLVLVRAGAVPAAEAVEPTSAWTTTVGELAARADHQGLRLALETGAEPGDVLAGRLDALDRPNLAASIDPATFLRGGLDPVAAVSALGAWVAHAYLHQPVGAVSGAELARFGIRRSTASLDWEAYLGAFEEINYRGRLTIWPDSTTDLFGRYRAIAASLQQV